MYASRRVAPQPRLPTQRLRPLPSIHPHRLAHGRADFGLDDEVGDGVLVGGVKGSWDYLYSCFKAAMSDRPLADRRKMFAENALRFYGIKV